MTWKQDADNNWLQVLMTFNHTPVWRQADAPQTVLTVTGHATPFRPDEVELINAYGINGMNLRCRASQFPTAPKKLDQFEVLGRIWTVGGVTPVIGAGGYVLLYHCYLRG